MKGNDRLVNIVLIMARIVFGITFVFSGFVKAVDPIGFAYKIEDYLIAFELIPFIPLALTFAVVLILVELLLGIFILLGLYRKLSAAVGVLFMAVMTPMTLYIALKNPVADCGCFGDALVISNWHTFYKNIVLVLLALLLLVFHKRIKPLYANKSRGLVVVFVFLFSLLFCLYNILYLPIIDFRPYKVGVSIAEQMESDVSKGDVYENTYVYERDGVEQEFAEDNFPWEDSTWTFVDFKSTLIKEGEQPLIDEFYITAYDKEDAGRFVKGRDITEDILANEVVLFVVSISLDDASIKGMKQIIELAEYAADNDIEMLVATSSGAAAIEQWHREWGNPKMAYGMMDELTLKTIVRSNPGLLLLNEGAIVGKWSSRRLPSQLRVEGMVAKIEAREKSLPINNNSTASLLIICAIFVIPLLAIKWHERRDKK